MTLFAAKQRAHVEPAPPDGETLAKRDAGRVRAEDARALHGWMSALPIGPSLETGTAALVTAARWLRLGAAPFEAERAPFARLRLLVETLETVPVWRRAFAACVGVVCHDGEALPALESALPNDRGIWPESSDWLARRLLPAPEEPRDLGALLSRLFPTERDAEWLASVPEELAGRFYRAILDGAGGEPFVGMNQALLDAVALVATRTSALGLSREIRARSPDVALAASPFFFLPRLCDALLTGIGSAASCREQIGACREVLEAVHAHLEEFGVSVDVVYRMEVIEKNLDRLGELLAVAGARDPEARARAAVALLGHLALARARDPSLRDILRTNLHLMARKVIEHAGESGEHYITATPLEWWRMLASGAGGGLLTGLTVVFKFLISAAGFPLFLEGAFSSANYAASFLAMQLFGFTLATKQPSMIAAALAGSLDGSGREPKLDGLVTLISRICRSQLAAAVGNVGTVMVAAIGFHLVYASATGHPFLDQAAAEHAIESLHPTHSGTLFFAALTGLLLWLSSLGAGWLENWSTYRRLPEAIALHRFGRLVGPRTMQWLSRAFAHGVSGVGGNVSIGVLLGMVPVIGRFFGLPLEVRHVTLSTGGLTLAACSTGAHPGIYPAIAGIAAILALNFGVSFALALAVALRARAVDHAGRRLLRAVAARFVREPLPFFLPLEGSDEGPAPPR